MAEHHIDGVKWFDRELAHKGIQVIGNRAGNWGLSVASAVVRMQAGERFFVIDSMSGKRVYIQVVKTDGDIPYIRTYLVDRWTDHLLALQSLPDVELID